MAALAALLIVTACSSPPEPGAEVTGSTSPPDGGSVSAHQRDPGRTRPLVAGVGWQEAVVRRGRNEAPTRQAHEEPAPAAPADDEAQDQAGPNPSPYPEVASPAPSPSPSPAPAAAASPPPSDEGTDEQPPPDGGSEQVVVGQAAVARRAPAQLAGEGWRATLRPIAHKVEGAWQVFDQAVALLDDPGRVIHLDEAFAQRYGRGMVERAAAALAVDGLDLVVAAGTVDARDGDGLSTVALLEGCGGVAGRTDRRGTSDHLVRRADGSLVGVSLAGSADVVICPSLDPAAAELAVTHELAHAAGLDHVAARCNLMAERLATDCMRSDDPQAQAGLVAMYASWGTP